MANIQIRSEGRRHYIEGNTFAIKDRLRGAGCKWDGERRAWWTGKREVAELFVGQAAETATSQVPQVEGLKSETEIAGKARYKGREYILVWQGETKRGRAAKLAFTDGSKVFWAGAGEYEVTKLYREYRGQAMTYGRLLRLREEYAEAKKQGNEDGIADGRRYECEECGEWVTRGSGSRCWETGCAH